MRLTTFDGMYPKIDSQDSPPQAAIYAENCDLYAGRIDPFRAPGGAMPIVDINGNPSTGPFATVYKAGPAWVGFEKHTFIVPDVSRRGGEDAFLFVQDGKLWRSSSAWLAAKRAPEPVGIEPPTLPPQAALVSGGGDKYEVPQMPCDIEMGGEDCNEDAQPPEARAYLMTYVARPGCGAGEEESAPSTPSNVVEVRDGDAVLLVDPNTNVPPNAVARRWYRAVAGSDGKAIWLLAGESPIAQPAYLDDAHALALGRHMDTEAHLPPPACLDGVALLGNTDTVVWSGDQFWVSEPMLPHAYPPMWRRQVMYEIVAMVGVTPFVEAEVHYVGYILTKGKPYVVGGRLPEEITVRELQAWEPALTPHGWAEAEGGVFYASRYGLVYLAGTDIKRFLDPYTTDIEWLDFDPMHLLLRYWNGRLWGFGPRKSFVLPFSRYREDRKALLVMLTLHPTAVYSAADVPLTIFDAGHLREWGAGTERMRATWRSRTFTMPGLWWPAAMKVVADFYVRPREAEHAQRELDGWLARHSHAGVSQFFCLYPEYEPLLASLEPSVVVRLYSDKREVFERRVTSDRPFRTNRRRRGIDWEFEVVTEIPVRELHLETSIQDLTQLGLGVGNSV